MTTTQTDCFQHIPDLIQRIRSVMATFETRPQQEAMMDAVAEAYRNSEITLIEAGTGTGKSLAYLIPALLWAVEKKERTVIATHTITLQEQLLHKDLPLLQKVLGKPVKAVLVKGMHNYLCLRRLSETSMEKLLLDDREKDEIETIEAWAEKTTEGSRSGLPMVPSGRTWERVCAEHDTCNYRKCPHYNRCFFFRARTEAQDAQILIVNHHLLFADLVQRHAEEDYKKPFVLPAYQHVVFDEAHHIEDVATDFFASRCSRLALLRILSRLASEKGKVEQGKLTQLRTKLAQSKEQEVKPLLQRLNIEFPALRKTVGQAVVTAFQSIETFLRSQVPQKEQDEGETTLRLLPRHRSEEAWKEEVIPDVSLLVQELGGYTKALSLLMEGVEKMPDPIPEHTEGIRYELNGMGRRLEEAAQTLQQLTKSNDDPNRVQWIQRKERKMFPNVEWVEADLAIAPLLQEALLEPMASVVFCSATLTSQKSFSFAKNRLGMDEAFCEKRSVKTHLFESPFDYGQQMFFGLPTDFPPPDAREFLQQAMEFLDKVVDACGGNALFLFTSYAMMDRCHRTLKPLLEKRGFPVLKQGDDPRHRLLERFRSSKGAVLFGTKTFWEGIDVQGEALGCVVIVKLPFSVPSEPLAEARMEAVTKEGRSAFWELAVPQATVRFKQGFGRLIRNQKDRGCVICLDVRLGTKSYGKAFLDSLPACPLVMADREYLLGQVRRFFNASLP